MLKIGRKYNPALEESIILHPHISDLLCSGTSETLMVQLLQTDGRSLLFRVAKIVLKASFINRGFLNSFCEVCRGCICGSRGLETKQLMKSKPAVYGRGLLISLATALGEQQ